MRTPPRTTAARAKHRAVSCPRRGRVVATLGQGFSLIEVTIVLLIMSIMVAAAAPRWVSSLQRYRVTNAAHRVVEDLKRAQLAAFRSSSHKTVTFDVAAGQYTLAEVTPLERPSGDYVVRLGESPYQSALVSVWGGTGTQTITFDGFGIPDKGGQIVIAAGNLQRTITVDANSGTAVLP